MRIAVAADVDRACIYKLVRNPTGRATTASRVHEWNNPKSEIERGFVDVPEVPFDPDFRAWSDTLERGEIINDAIVDRPSHEQPLFDSLGILAIAAVPIFVARQCWGFLAFKSCREVRVWRPSDIQLLEAATAGFGNAIERHVATLALQQANERLAAQASELQRGRRAALSLIEDAQRERERAAAANEAKSTFLAVMSHEMRTPLNGILGFVDLLLADELAPEHRDSLRTISSSGRSLLTLINDLLDLARIESGAIELEPVTGSFREILSADFATLGKLAEKKGIGLHVDIDPEVPDTLLLDFGRYRQIVMNVIGNAIKFTDDGSIRASIRAIDPSSTSVTLDCIVRDTGTGIPPESIEQIFNPFGQAHHSIQRRFGGTGLGLAICRDLCRLMGGSIDVQSQLGVGSTFHFSVQATAATSPATPKPPTRDNDFPNLSATHPASILVVDDVAINRKLIGSFLRRLGYQPQFAGDGSEAIELAAATKFDVILMDVFMPRVDGYEATQQIRTNENGSTPSRIIGISADAMSENRTRCREAGMDAFLTKPVHLRDLLDVLRSSLENRSAPGQNSSLANSDEPAIVPNP